MTRGVTRDLCCALALAVSLALGAATGARADGDPASDILLVQNVFYPYEPSTSVALQRRLDGAAAAAATAGLPIKVALIASPVDLGAVSSLWGKPQQYAGYLDDELSSTGPEPLLVVMPDGYAARSLTRREMAALAALPLPSGRTSDALASAALTAVRRIAAADGHPLAAGALAASGGSGNSLLIVIALALAAVLTAGMISAVTLHRRPAAGHSRPARGKRGRGRRRSRA